MLHIDRPCASLPRLLPLLDPDHFCDPGFFREMAAIGYRQVLLGGTGSGAMARAAEAARQSVGLEVLVYPASPDGVCEADLIILPDVMNSASAHARPFGPAAVATALAAAELGCPCLPVAHFIQGDSTACRHYEATPLRGDDELVGVCRYAAMLGYRHIALDYEGTDDRVTPELAARIKTGTCGGWLTVSAELDPDGAAALLEFGVDTFVLPSDVLERAADPLALARSFHERLLASARG